MSAENHWKVGFAMSATIHGVFLLLLLTVVPVSGVHPPTQSTSLSVWPQAPAAMTACIGSRAPHIVIGRAAQSSEETSLLPGLWTGRSHRAGCWTAAGRGLLEDSETAVDSTLVLSEPSSHLLTRYVEVSSRPVDALRWNMNKIKLPFW